MKRFLALLVTLLTATTGLTLAAAPARADAATSQLYGNVTDGPTAPRVSANSSPPSVQPGADYDALHFRAITLIVTASGDYSIVQSATSDGAESDGKYDGFAELYKDGFDPTNPVTHLVAASDDGPGGSRQPHLDSVNLLAGHRYVYVATTFSESFQNATANGGFYLYLAGPARVRALADPTYTIARGTNAGHGAIGIAVVPPAGLAAVTAVQILLWNQADGTPVALPAAVESGGEWAAGSTNIPAAARLRISVSVSTADGTVSWTPVGHALDDDSPQLKAWPGATPLTAQVYITHPQAAGRPEAQLQLDLTVTGGGVTRHFHHSTFSFIADDIGPLAPSTSYSITATASTGLEPTPLVSTTEVVSTGALTPVGRATLVDATPRNASKHRYQSLGFDVTVAGSYLIAGIGDSTSWDDALQIHRGTYDPTRTYPVAEVDAALDPLPVDGSISARSDDAGRFADNLVPATLTPGHYSAVIDQIGSALGRADLYITGPGPVTVTPFGAPDAPAVSGAVPGNARAVVSASPQGNDQGSPVTGFAVTATAAGHPTVTAAGPSPVTLTGLVNGVTYTVRAASTNANGTGPVSLTGISVTPGAVAPTAPTVAVTATRLTSALLTVGAPAAPGTDAVTGYVLTLAAGKNVITARAAAPGPLSVSGLVPHTSYAVSVVATSLAGTSPASATTEKTLKPSVKLALKKGRLTATTLLAGKALGKQKVRLLARRKGARTFKTLSTRTTSSKGTFTFSTTPVKGTAYEVQLVIGTYVLTTGKVTAS